MVKLILGKSTIVGIYINWELVNHKQQKPLAVWVRKRKSNLP